MINGMITGMMAVLKRSLGRRAEGHIERDPDLLRKSALDYVAGLQRIELSTIDANDRRCPFCWGQFDEDDNGIPIVSDGTAATTVDPVRTGCGHMFHATCLANIVEKSSRDYPLCRTQLCYQIVNGSYVTVLTT
jgi:hypothetical protein